jgi:hypothetical protein
MNEDNMTDQTDNVQAERPWAKALDEWHDNGTNAADAAEREKQAVAAEEYQADRRRHYYYTGEDVGGWLGSPSCSGREVYCLRGRTIDWR